ncbi:MAG: hypothetical protein WC648_01390 [Candidatus Paceibacterota bacterium]|jgi:predicted GH43/DUF377 family glycosyl hydrolase
MFTVNRSEFNPLLSPLREHPWEASAAFNGCPIIRGKKTVMLYRAMSEADLLRDPHVKMSVIARADSIDGVKYENRRVLISPDREFDFYGCEDPRVTKLGKTYYIFYTALGGYPYSADNIKVAVALSDDLVTIKEKHLVTPFNAKAMALFPNKVNGKMAALLTVNTDRKPSDICYVEFDKVEDMWSVDFWNNWAKKLEAHKINLRRFPDDQLELGAPPVLTKKGWIIAYSHIQRYGKSDQVFGIETALLDIDNPRHVIGRTKGPFMVPDDYYEHTGQVAHVIFPSGALIRNEKLEIYYGAADTHVAMASIPLDNLLESMTGLQKSLLKRFPGNPILSPRPSMLWETRGTLNPAAIDLDNKIHILYRAVSVDNISTVGYAVSSDGLSIDERLDKPIYFPRADFESNGCEDPRIMEIEKRVYMTYTAYDGITPRVAVSSIPTTDFLKRRWGSWAKPEIITPPSVANKDSAILPEKIKGGYLVFHRVNESICADFVASLDFSKQKITQCIEIITPRKGMWDGGKVGISSPPIKTKQGWLLLYHGVSWSTTYRVGAVLLDLDDPTIVRARSAIPLFEPEEQYECKGIVPNVVFPCGLVFRGQMAYMYYGAGDAVVGVATMKISALLKTLEI